jgi:hypothetical protein
VQMARKSRVHRPGLRDSRIFPRARFSPLATPGLTIRGSPWKSVWGKRYFQFWRGQMLDLVAPISRDSGPAIWALEFVLAEAACANNLASRMGSKTPRLTNGRSNSKVSSRSHNRSLGKSSEDFTSFHRPWRERTTSQAR